MSSFQHLEIEQDGPVARVWLNRPEIHNAFDDVLIGVLTACFTALQADDAVRIIVLGGRGKSFCAGADLNWMKRMVSYSREENLADSRKLLEMLRTLDECDKPVLARVHGAALGGGAGLVSVADIAVAAEGAKFGTTEAKLGILPAVISPFVLARIGPAHARELFLTGERIDAARAQAVGLVQHVVPADELDACLDRKIELLLSSGPKAMARAKRLIREVAWKGAAEVGDTVVEAIAEARVSDEGQEGMAAFLERRPPAFRKPS